MSQKCMRSIVQFTIEMKKGKTFNCGILMFPIKYSVTITIKLLFTMVDKVSQT